MSSAARRSSGRRRSFSCCARREAPPADTARRIPPDVRVPLARRRTMGARRRPGRDGTVGVPAAGDESIPFGSAPDAESPRSRGLPLSPARAPEPRLVWLRAFHETYNPSLAPRVFAASLAQVPGRYPHDDRARPRRRKSREGTGGLGLGCRPDSVPRPGPEGRRRTASLSRETSFSTRRTSTTHRSASSRPWPAACASSARTWVGCRTSFGMAKRPSRPAQRSRGMVRPSCVVPRNQVSPTGCRREAVNGPTMDWSRVLPKWEALFRAAKPSFARHSRRDQYPTC